MRIPDNADKPWLILGPVLSHIGLQSVCAEVLIVSRALLQPAVEMHDHSTALSQVAILHSTRVIRRRTK